MNRNTTQRLQKDYEKQFYSRTVLFAKQALRWKKIPTTTELMNKLREARVSIACNEDLLQTPNGQHMMLMSTNLLSRFCPNLDITIPKDSRIMIPTIYPQKETSFSNHLVKLFKAINPLGRLRLKSHPKEEYDAAINIGEDNISSRRTIFINSQGWIAHINTKGEPLASISKKQNPIGAQLAACLGATEAFKAIFSKTSTCNPHDVSPSGSLAFSAFDYTFNRPFMKNPSLPTSISLNTIHLVGAGAIGSATFYALQSTPGVAGSLVVIDNELIELSNLNRYLLATVKDALRKRSKVKILKNFMSNSFKVTAFEGHYQDYIRREENRDFDLMVLCVDNDETRWSIQKDFPRIILNGATGISSITISRHDDFINKACLGCLYPMEKEPIHPTPCPTTSFVSGLAGVLLAAEILKERIDEFEKFVLDNELYLDCLKLPETLRIRRPRKSERCGCSCQDPRVIKAFLRSKRDLNTFDGNRK